MRLAGHAARMENMKNKYKAQNGEAIVVTDRGVT
jgi:hypothetical protein